MYLSQLEPFFDYDELLPYSFLGLLTTNQTEDMLKCADVEGLLKLPVDGILGLAEYQPDFSYNVSTNKEKFHFTW